MSSSLALDVAWSLAKMSPKGLSSSESLLLDAIAGNGVRVLLASKMSPFFGATIGKGAEGLLVPES